MEPYISKESIEKERIGSCYISRKNQKKEKEKNRIYFEIGCS
jgi:hypothetical protein